MGRWGISVHDYIDIVQWQGGEIKASRLFIGQHNNMLGEMR